MYPRRCRNSVGWKSVLRTRGRTIKREITYLRPWDSDSTRDLHTIRIVCRFHVNDRAISAFLLIEGYRRPPIRHPLIRTENSNSETHFYLRAKEKTVGYYHFEESGDLDEWSLNLRSWTRHWQGQGLKLEDQLKIQLEFRIISEESRGINIAKSEVQILSSGFFDNGWTNCTPVVHHQSQMQRERESEKVMIF